MTINIVKITLSLMFYISLVRATNIGLFYPSDENKLSTIDYTPQTLTNFVLLILLVGYIFLSDNYKFVIDILKKPLILFFTIGTFLTIITSVDIIESIKFVLAVIVISVPSVIYAQTYGVDSLLKKVALFIAVIACINLIYTLIFPQYAIMSAAHSGRWKGMFEHKNYSAPFFAIGLFILINQFDKFLGFQKFFIIFSMGICLLFIVMSGSATAIVLLALMLIIYPLFLISFRITPKERVFVFLMASSLSLLAFVFLGPILSDVFFGLTGRDATLTGRTDIWAGLLQVALKRPVFGWGAGMAGRSDFIEQFHYIMGKEASSSHNSYIDLILNFGFPIAGMILFTILKIFFSSIFGVFRKKSDLKYTALAASLILSALAIGFSGGGVILSRSIFWMYMLIGLIIMTQEQKRLSR